MACNRDDSILRPGPTDESVLRLQRHHRSTEIWDSQMGRILDTRNASGLLRALTDSRRDRRVESYIIRAGLYGFYRLGSVQVYRPLITSLVERWRVETHTFHLPVGECTITLQDVSVITGLPIDGRAVTGTDVAYPTDMWCELIGQILGVSPPSDALKGSQLRISWLLDNFRDLDDDADEQTVIHHSRATLFMLIGGCLFPNKSGNFIYLIYLPLVQDLDRLGDYSWGSATLAFLYRELCRATRPEAKEIAGPLAIVQIWAWERLSFLRPLIHGRERRGFVQHIPIAGDGDDAPRDPYGCRWRAALSLTFSRTLVECRDQLDIMSDGQMCWQPYPQNVVLAISDREVWLARVPLICYDIVELHFPDRVLRQFGMIQLPPPPCDTSPILHAIDRRGRAGRDWSIHHRSHIMLWDDRRDHLVVADPLMNRMDPNDQYMRWYHMITRHPIGPLGDVPDIGSQPIAAQREALVQTLTMASRIANQFRGCDNIEEVHRMATTLSEQCRVTMNMVNEGYRIHDFGVASTSVPEGDLPLTTQEIQPQTQSQHEGRRNPRRKTTRRP